MFNKLWKRFFSVKNEKKQSNYIVAQLNDKIMPIDRGEIYGTPIDEFLKQKNYGEVTGGGTLQSKTGEIDYCDVEIELRPEVINDGTIREIITKFEQLGAPKGSKMIIETTDERIDFGKFEGMAVYLDGVNLSEEVYKNSDTKIVAAEIRKLAKIEGEVLRYWEGNIETALYFYGNSFKEMKESIVDFINTNPECENARIEQIA